jgi:hypothetical protein
MGNNMMKIRKMGLTLSVALMMFTGIAVMGLSPASAASGPIGTQAFCSPNPGGGYVHTGLVFPTCNACLIEAIDWEATGNFKAVCWGPNNPNIDHSLWVKCIVCQKREIVNVPISRPRPDVTSLFGAVSEPSIS